MLLNKWGKFILFVMTVNVVLLMAVGVLVNRNIRQTERIREANDEIGTSVDDLEEFVDELEADDPEQEELNAAISEAVRQVPQIRSILCEHVPSATACQTPPGG